MSGKKFKDYYQDPEYRKKHLETLKEKVTCECGEQVGKGYLKVHQKTDKHAHELKYKELREKKLKKKEEKE